MNKSDLVRMTAKRTSVTVPVVDDVVSTLLELVALNLAVGEEVSFRGFGKFQPRTRPPVKLRRPTDGTAIDVESRQTAVFLPSVTLKQKLNANPM